MWRFCVIREIYEILPCYHTSQVALVLKNLPASSGDTRNTGSIAGSRRSSGVRNGTPLNILAWKIAWAKELQAIVHGAANSQT